ncbi:MAG TPA: S8 family serine peptidase [Solirubrobacterales bacterium]|nr:S8 family serine peptidase [Solirubrobacterales bacterium]
MRPVRKRLAARTATFVALAFSALVPVAAANAALVPLQHGPGTPLRDGKRLIFDVRFERGAVAGLDELRAAGAEIVHTSRRYQTVTVAVKPADLPALDGVARVGGVKEVVRPLVMGADCGGILRSEGDSQLLAPNARANIGVDGTGVTVGILSDSYDRDPTAPTRAVTDVATGDLPGPGSPCGSTAPVNVLDDSVQESDEGRAMAQIVRDLAPGASISFATAFKGEAAFAASIKALAQAGARVITDDVVYFEEPFFQDGPIAVAIDEVAAAGVSYFSAAGNNNLFSGGNEVGSWEAPFRNAETCPPGLPSGEEQCADFNPGGGTDTLFNFSVPSEGELILDLQWAEPRGGVATDFDAYLINSKGQIVDSSNDDNIGGTQRPYELVRTENTGESAVPVWLAITRKAGSGTPRLKWVQLGNAVPAATQYETSSGDVFGPTVFGHAAAKGAIAVGAVRFNTASAPETFSSRGPVTNYFGPVVGAGPAAPLALPEVVSKPDIAASDGGVNTFFGSFTGGFWRFFGTSAAAPHAAAVAALALQANPGATPTQIRNALTSTARPVGTFGPLAVGAGLIDAGAAVNSLALAPGVAVTVPPAARSRVRQPTFEFEASRPATYSCAIDGVAMPCASPFTWPQPLGDGPHSLVVGATDLAGRVGSSAAVGFTIDSKAPQTTIVKKPPKVVRTSNFGARVVFRFRSSERGARFRCKIDKTGYRKCGKRLSKRFTLGAHVLRVKAADAVGNLDPSPAVYRFRVVRKP